jgi:hypothetical protein
MVRTHWFLGSEDGEDALVSGFVTQPDIFDRAEFDGRSKFSSLCASCLFDCRGMLERVVPRKGVSDSYVC